MLKKTAVFIFVFILTAMSAVSVNALMPVSSGFILDDGSRVTIPVPFEVEKIVSSFEGGSYDSLNNPQDLYYDDNGFYYIADTGNNRVLRLDKDFKVVAEFTEADGIAFSEPSGVSTDSDGDIYIADTGNARVVHFTPSGEYAESFVKPESELLYDVEFFAPSKVEFDPVSKNLYVIQGRQFMRIDALNRFRGYIGDNEVGFDLWDYFFRKFATEKQKMQTEKRAPDPYTNFCFGEEGRLYAVGLSDSQRISVINTVGKNIYPSGDYGETSYNNDGSAVTPVFTDIAVNSNGIIFVSEQNTGCIYQYDDEGNLLGAFGGKGSGNSQFEIISSIVINGDDSLVTLDSSLGRIQVFEATDFMKNVHSAVSLYQSGKYSESYEKWQEVRDKNAGYTLARQKIGEIEYKNGNYETAADEFYKGDDRENYGKAFSKIRYLFFKEHFAAVSIGVLVLIVLVVLLVRFGRGFIARMRKRLWYSGGGE